MVARKLYLLVGVGIASVLSLSLVLSLGSSIWKSNDRYADGLVQQGMATGQNASNSYNSSSSSENNSTNNQTNTSNNNSSTTIATTNETNQNTTQTNNNKPRLPTKADLENLTTFELFAKYPALENLTSTSLNNSTVNGTTKQESNIAQLSNQSSSNNNSSEANQPGNVTISAGSTQVQAIENNTSNQTNLNYLTSIQNTINSLNQTITELQKQMVNSSTSINIDNLVVNARNSTTNNAIANNPSTTTTASSNETNNNAVAVHFSSTKRLTGDLTKDDYIIVGHFSNPTTQDAQRQLQLKIPCNNDNEPEMKLLVGSIPNLKEIGLGKAIEKATVDGSTKELVLSKSGQYCLYRVDLPSNTSDALLINDTGETLKLSKMRYYVTVTESSGQ